MEEEGGGIFLKGFVRLFYGLSILRTIGTLQYTCVGKSLRQCGTFQERFCVCSASELKVMALEFSGRATEMRRKLRKLCYIYSKCSDSNPIAKAMPPGIFDKALIPAFLDCLIHC